MTQNITGNALNSAGFHAASRWTPQAPGGIKSAIYRRTGSQQ
jgi:hypothetical protein